MSKIKQISKQTCKLCLEARFYVYGHFRLDPKELFYIGKGTSKRAFTNAGRNKYWKQIDKKYGTYIIIFENELTEDFAYQLEYKLITYFRPKANFSDGGRHASSGRKKTLKEKRRIAKSLKGRKRPLEFKKRLSLIMKEYYKINAPPQIGRKASEETKRKIGEKSRGRKHPNSKKIKCIETGKIFRDSVDAAKWAKGYPSHIIRCCKGDKYSITSAGYHWKYA